VAFSVLGFSLEPCGIFTPIMRRDGALLLFALLLLLVGFSVGADSQARISTTLTLLSCDYVKMTQYTSVDPTRIFTTFVETKTGLRYLGGASDTTGQSGSVAAPNTQQDPTKTKQSSPVNSYVSYQTMQLLILSGNAKKNEWRVILLDADGNVAYPYTFPNLAAVPAGLSNNSLNSDLFLGNQDKSLTLLAMDRQWVGENSTFVMSLAGSFDGRVVLRSEIPVIETIKPTYTYYNLYIDRSFYYAWNGTACVPATGSNRTRVAFNASCGSNTECSETNARILFGTDLPAGKGALGTEIINGVVTANQVHFEPGRAGVNKWYIPSLKDQCSDNLVNADERAGYYLITSFEATVVPAVTKTIYPYVRWRCCVNVNGVDEKPTTPLLVLDTKNDPFADLSYHILVSILDFEPKNYLSTVRFDNLPSEKDSIRNYQPYIIGIQTYTNKYSTPVTYDFSVTRDFTTQTVVQLGGSVGLSLTLEFSYETFFTSGSISVNIAGRFNYDKSTSNSLTETVRVDAAIEVQPFSKVNVTGLVQVGTITGPVTGHVTRSIILDTAPGKNPRNITFKSEYVTLGNYVASKAEASTAVLEYLGLVEDVPPPILNCGPSEAIVRLFVDEQCQVPLPDLRSSAVIKGALGGLVEDPFSSTNLEQYYEPYSTLYPKSTPYQIILSSTDALEQTVSCTVPVAVLDSHPPVIKCPQQLTLLVNETTGFATMPNMTASSVGGPSTIFEMIGGSYTDNCYGVVEAVYNIGQSIAPGTNLVPGRYSTTLTVTDPSGNQDRCDLRVYAESLYCPLPDQIVQVDESCYGSMTDVANAAFIQRLLPTSNTPLQVEFDMYMNDALLYPTRPITVNLRATDDIGFVVQCPVRIVAVDILPPQINCPSELIVHVDPSTGQGAVPLLAGPYGGSAYFEEMGGSVADNCEVINQTAVTQSLPAGTLRLPGTYELILTAVDFAGNTESCPVRLQVLPIDCPPTQTLTVGSDCTADFPDLTDVALLQNANTTYTYSYADANLDYYDDMTPHFPGTYTLTIVGVDSTNRVVNCKVEVIVVDRIPPTVFCPEGVIIVHVNPVTGLGAIPNFAGPFGGSAFFQEIGGGASDNCEDAAPLSPQPSIIQSPPAGTQVGTGINIVTITAVDAAGNNATCTFQVEVLPIDCPPPQTLIADSDSCTVAFPDFTETSLLQRYQREYNFTMDHAGLDFYEDGTEHFPGTYTITLVGSDQLKRTVTCSLSVQVVDTTPPLITCPSDVYAFVDPATRTATMPEFSGVEPAWFAAHGGSAMDNCESRGQTRVQQSIVAGTLLPPGTYDQVMTAIDIYGNKVSCTFKFEVLPIDCPTTPQKMPVTESCGPDDFDYTDFAFLQRNFQVSNFSTSDGRFSITEPTDYMGYPGTYIFTMAGVDDFEQVAVCNFTVNVVDELPPSISCPRTVVLLADPITGLATMPNYAGTAGNYDFERLGGAYSDNCMFIKPWDFNITQSRPAGSPIPPGQTILQLTGTDYFGNKEVCFTKIWVNRVPCPSTSVIIPIEDNCWAPLRDFTDEAFLYAGVPADEPALMLDIDQFPAAGTAFRPSTVIVAVTAVDDFDKSGTCAVTVNFVDTIKPDVLCPLPTTVSVGASSGRGTMPDFVGSPNIGSPSFWHNDGNDFYQNLYKAVGSDNCIDDGNVTFSQSVPAGDTFAPGTVPVIIRGTDPYGNYHECNLIVTFADTTPPVVRCPPPVTVGIDQYCNATWPNYSGSNFFSAGGNATDNWTPSANLTIVQASTAGTTVGVSTNELVLSITDAAGNTAKCTSIFNVKDLTAPDITCPNPITLSANAKCLAPVPDMYSCNAPDFFDNGGCVTEYCSPPVLRSQNIPRLTLIGPPGVNLTITATDRGGNSKNCTVPIFVEDTTPPSITNMRTNVTFLWPPNHELWAVAVFYTVSDNCSPAINVSCSLAITSNEIDKGWNDWDVANDTLVHPSVNNKTKQPDSTVINQNLVYLRSEWLGNSGVDLGNGNGNKNGQQDPNTQLDANGKGRIYTITVTCRDLVGNVNRNSTNVYVSK